jgi:tRNA threonylcarbamoyladenosine biosynthesis protein TsaB
MRSILGIDTAGPRGSVAIAVDGKARGSEPLAPGGHSSGLAVAVERLLAAKGIGVRDLAGIAVSEGPGSFTGLRIGLAWAKGAAIGGGVPLLMVPAHEALAHASRALAPRFATVTQGERGHAMAALWAGGAGAAGLLWGPEVVAEEDLVGRVRGEAGEDVPFAAATEALEELVQDLDGTLLVTVPLAPAVAELGDRALAAKRIADPRAAAPVYGRAPNARKPAAR